MSRELGHSPWDGLLDELDQWNFEGEEATFWWRDDDAVRPHPLLDRLLDLLEHWGVPVSLAVIPGNLEEVWADTLDRYRGIAVLQHGICHQNHAEAHQKKQELVAHRSYPWQEELVVGRRTIEHVFGSRSLPVLVPPWNRIDDTLLPALGSLGYRGLSGFGPRTAPSVGEHLWIINTHVDLVQWKQGRTFVGEQAVIEQLVSHLSAKRQGMADRAEPTGILSHHQVMDESCLAFLPRMLEVLDHHPAATWLPAERVFQLPWR